MGRNISGARMAEELMVRPGGATMREIIAATGGPQYNKLKQMESRGFTIEKVRDGRETRYFARPPGPRSYEATITGKGQITLPKDIREKAGLGIGEKVRLAIDAEDRVVLTPAGRSVRRLFGALGKPPRAATVEEIQEAVRDQAVERLRRSVGRRK